MWRKHFDEVVGAIQDPDRLAEEACEAGLIATPIKEALMNAMYPDKGLTVLLTIDSQIRERPQLLHTHVIPLLRRQPGLVRVVSTLTASQCGELLNTLV